MQVWIGTCPHILFYILLLLSMCTEWLYNLFSLSSYLFANICWTNRWLCNSFMTQSQSGDLCACAPESDSVLCISKSFVPSRVSVFSPYPDVVWYTHTLSHVGERGSGVLSNFSGHIGPGRSQTESMMFLNCNLVILVFWVTFIVTWGGPGQYIKNVHIRDLRSLTN